MGLHHPSQYVLRKNMCTWEKGAGLGWVVAASYSVICPELTRTVSMTM
jgi:hypothetical protein